jgi:hypothetical protein
MANDSKQYQEEEYLFSEDEHADPLSPGEPSADIPGVTSEKQTFFSGARKNIFIGLALLIVIYIVYKVISSFFVSNDVRQMPSIPNQQTQTTMPTTPTAGTSTVVSNQPSTTPTVPEGASLHDAVNYYNQNRQDEQQVSQLSDTVQNIGQQVNNLQNTTQDLQSTVDSINAQLTQVNTALTALTNQMQIQENRWVQMQKKAKPKRVAHTVVVKRDAYQTLAVIPGRAWLKSSRGATITVGVGSSIPGYGTVTNINTQTGVIMMSSGSSIQYAPNDE